MVELAVSRPRRGVFIVLEGPDKSGKSTLAEFLVRKLRARGLRVTHTREPGGTSFAEAIRRILLDPAHRVHPLAELLLYEAARAQHTHEKLLPALGDGHAVICERYTMATMVYQGFGRGIALPLIRRLNRIATNGLSPDLTLVLDIPESEFTRRRPGRKHDRLERAGAAFRRKVRAGYERLARKQPRTHLLRSDRAKDTVQGEALGLVERALGSRKTAPHA